jgi:hypothetical protein
MHIQKFPISTHISLVLRQHHTIAPRIQMDSKIRRIPSTGVGARNDKTLAQYSRHKVNPLCHPHLCHRFVRGIQMGT